jgi:hydrogenase/urease accessory protein HupE
VVAIRRAWPFALISGSTALFAFLALPSQSLPHQYARGDMVLFLPYVGCGMLAAGFGISVVLLLHRPPRRRRHLPVPFVLAPLLPIVVGMCGGNRSRWETGLLCAAVAVGVHLALEMRPIPGVALVAVLAAGFVLTTAACQTRWRAEDFQATGMPYVVAEIPGYRLAGTYADTGAIRLAYDDTAGARKQIGASVLRRTCAARLERDRACIDLAGGYHLTIGDVYGAQEALPGGITVRAVPAAYLASFPTGDSVPPD